VSASKLVRWTPDEDRLVRALAPAEAARRLGRTLEAVRTRRRRLKGSPPVRGRPVASEREARAAIWWLLSWLAAQGLRPDWDRVLGHLRNSGDWVGELATIRRTQQAQQWVRLMTDAAGWRSRRDV
jgi:hypothetical protein